MSVFDEAMSVVQGVTNNQNSSKQELVVERPDALLPCLEPVGRMLPLKALGKPHKRDIFRGYDMCQDEIADMYEDAADLLSATLKCNTRWISPQKKAAVDDQKIREALFSHQPPLDRLAFSSGGVATAEVAAKPVQEITRLLVDTVRDQCLALINGLNRQLAYLSSIEQIGSIQWLSDDVCRFSFYQNVITDRKINSRTRSEVKGFERHTKTRDSYDRTLEHIKIVHDVIDAQKHPVPAAHVEMPERVEELIDAIPAWLAPMAAVVTGFEISEESSSQSATLDQWTETSTRIEQLPRPVRRRRERTRHDPAVIIGHYVLTGWN